MANSGEKKTLLIALGGNALIQKGQEGTAQEQIDNLLEPMRVLARLSDEYNIVITHGNGPQAGNILLQQEGCDEVPKMPLDVVGAMTQGQIGYMLETNLDTAFNEIGGMEDKRFVTLITYTVVDGDDPKFKNPTKPVGPAFTKEEAEGKPYPMVETAKGMRRVVASPKPEAIINYREVKTLIEQDFIVICTGGGGIPVVRDGLAFKGVDAVIDKDLASALLAEKIGADVFIICTDEPGVAVDFGKPSQRFLETMTVAEAEGHIADNQFPDGSMLPKVEAAVQFAQNSGQTAVIAKLQDAESAIRLQSGTRITR